MTVIDYRNHGDEPSGLETFDHQGPGPSANCPFGQFINSAFENRRAIKWPGLGAPRPAPNVHNHFATPSVFFLRLL